MLSPFCSTLLRLSGEHMEKPSERMSAITLSFHCIETNLQGKPSDIILKHFQNVPLGIGSALSYSLGYLLQSTFYSSELLYLRYHIFASSSYLTTAFVGFPSLSSGWPSSFNGWLWLLRLSLSSWNWGSLSGGPAGPSNCLHRITHSFRRNQVVIYVLYIKNKRCIKRSKAFLGC